MKKITKYIIAGIMLFLSLTGCGNFDDLNTNPDDTLIVSPSMLCTNVVLRTMRNGGDSKAFISGNALSKYVGYATEGQMGTQYNSWDASSFDAYTILPNLEKMVELSSGSPMGESYRGIAKLTRALTFYQLTMEMGDIPYSEANKGEEGLYRPKYDKQEDILAAVLRELKEAEQHFANGIKFDGDPTPYKGDPAKWRQATNALTLRILMTLSKKENVASLNIKARFVEIVNSGNIMKSGNDFWGLEYTSLNKHPLSSTNTLFTQRTILSSLLVNNLKILNDRRLFYFGEPATEQIVAGKLPNDPAAYVGVDVAMNYTQMNTDYGLGKFSILNLRYVQEDACEPSRVMSYAEQQLILAEARIKGWITTGNAKDYYEQGVKSALADVMATKPERAHGMAIDQNYIDNYFTGNAAFKASTDDQLKQIWMQRYILNFIQQPQSVYFEYRRNNYPEFPINPTTSLNENNKNGIPMRWLYPSIESSKNRENLIKALNDQYGGIDEINKLMWVLQ